MLLLQLLLASVGSQIDCCLSWGLCSLYVRARVLVCVCVEQHVTIQAGNKNLSSIQYTSAFLFIPIFFLLLSSWTNYWDMNVSFTASYFEILTERHAKRLHFYYNFKVRSFAILCLFLRQFECLTKTFFRDICLKIQAV